MNTEVTYDARPCWVLIKTEGEVPAPRALKSPDDSLYRHLSSLLIKLSRPGRGRACQTFHLQMFRLKHKYHVSA